MQTYLTHGEEEVTEFKQISHHKENSATRNCLRYSRQFFSPRSRGRNTIDMFYYYLHYLI